MRTAHGKSPAMLGLLVSIAALVAALYLQIGLEWFPCPLCILQRYAYLLSGLGFLGLLMAGRGSKLAGFAGLIAFAGFAAGAGVAFYHVWVLSNPLQTCGVDPLQNMLNALPWVNLWPDMFTADGLCTEAYPPLLGLSLPMWSALGFLFQGLLLLLWKRRPS
jgi:protein dithiol:quinone oxidoreductase